MAKSPHAGHEKTNPNKANILVLRTRKLDDTYAISQYKVAVNAT
jgi:hypothetical protein